MSRSREDKLTEQFDAPPADGLKRFWMGIESWTEEWPDNTPFFWWISGIGCLYRVRPSFADSPEAAEYAGRKIPFDRNEGQNSRMSDDEYAAWIDRAFVSNTKICMLVDAPSEADAWTVIRTHFPDMKERLSSSAVETTLTSLASAGRFRHPNPPEPPASEPFARIIL